jgi:hypothetical protein
MPGASLKPASLPAGDQKVASQKVASLDSRPVKVISRGSADSFLRVFTRAVKALYSAENKAILSTRPRSYSCPEPQTKKLEDSSDRPQSLKELTRSCARLSGAPTKELAEAKLDLAEALFLTKSAATPGSRISQLFQKNVQRQPSDRENALSQLNGLGSRGQDANRGVNCTFLAAQIKEKRVPTEASANFADIQKRHERGEVIAPSELKTLNTNEALLLLGHASWKDAKTAEKFLSIANLTSLEPKEAATQFFPVNIRPQIEMYLDALVDTKGPALALERFTSDILVRNPSTRRSVLTSELKDIIQQMRQSYRNAAEDRQGSLQEAARFDPQKHHFDTVNELKKNIRELTSFDEESVKQVTSHAPSAERLMLDLFKEGLLADDGTQTKEQLKGLNRAVISGEGVDAIREKIANMPESKQEILRELFSYGLQVKEHFALERERNEKSIQKEGAPQQKKDKLEVIELEEKSQIRELLHHLDICVSGKKELYSSVGSYSEFVKFGLENFEQIFKD